MKEVNREREELSRRVGSECRWERMTKMGECDGMGGNKGWRERIRAGEG